jgi:hypothetical protein
VVSLKFDSSLICAKIPFVSEELHDMRCLILVVFFAASFCQWSSTGSLIAARSGHTATLLNSNRLLICGGRKNGGYEASCELYTVSGAVAATGISCVFFFLRRMLFVFLFSLLTGTLIAARSGHTATMLDSNNVLICGGANNGGFMASCELYNATSGVFSATGISCCF